MLLIIENKVVGWYPGAEEQTKGYQETLREKYGSRYKYYPGVLLTISNSPEGGNEEREKRHNASPLCLLSWDEVRGIIRPLLDDFPEDVRAFVRQYLYIIEEKLIHTGDDLAERLRNGHPQALEKLQEEPALLKSVDKPHRATVRRWVEYFEERPRRLRDKVAEYLTQKRRVSSDIITKSGGKGGLQAWQFLLWRERPSGVELGHLRGLGLAVRLRTL